MRQGAVSATIALNTNVKWLVEKVPRRVILFAPEGVDTSNWAGHRCTFCTLQRWKTDIEQALPSEVWLLLLQTHNEDSDTQSERSQDRQSQKLWWSKKPPSFMAPPAGTWKWRKNQDCSRSYGWIYLLRLLSCTTFNGEQVWIGERSQKICFRQVLVRSRSLSRHRF